jgi:hypothetical protein
VDQVFERYQVSNFSNNCEFCFLTVYSFFFRKSRTTFDTSDTRRAYGPIIIDYTKVQTKVTLKYDSWHKEALSKFGQLLGNEMGSFHSKVSKSRTDLEQQSIGEFLENSIIR